MQGGEGGGLQTTSGAVAEEQEEHGRIGYGRYPRYTPLAIALVLIASLFAIGLYQRGPDEEPSQRGELVGTLAPDVALTLLDGGRLRLWDLRGSVVVVNFWAEWCAPCKEEAPQFEAVHQEALRSGDKVVFVGVNLKNDRDEKARAFVDELGLTYAIGRDTGGDHPSRGPVETAFGIAPFYPTTIIIDPDGLIDSVYVAPMTADDLRSAIAAAT